MMIGFKDKYLGKVVISYYICLVLLFGGVQILIKKGNLEVAFTEYVYTLLIASVVGAFTLATAWAVISYFDDFIKGAIAFGFLVDILGYVGYKYFRPIYDFMQHVPITPRNAIVSTIVMVLFTIIYIVGYAKDAWWINPFD